MNNNSIKKQQRKVSAREWAEQFQSRYNRVRSEFEEHRRRSIRWKELFLIIIGAGLSANLIADLLLDIPWILIFMNAVPIFDFLYSIISLAGLVVFFAIIVWLFWRVETKTYLISKPTFTIQFKLDHLVDFIKPKFFREINLFLKWSGIRKQKWITFGTRLLGELTGWFPYIFPKESYSLLGNIVEIPNLFDVSKKMPDLQITYDISKVADGKVYREDLGVNVLMDVVLEPSREFALDFIGVRSIELRYHVTFEKPNQAMAGRFLEIFYQFYVSRLGTHSANVIRNMLLELARKAKEESPFLLFGHKDQLFSKGDKVFPQKQRR